MKKLCLSLLLAAAGTAAHAQLSLAPEAGLNMANMTLKMGSAAGGTLSTSLKTGLAAGAIAEQRLVSSLYLQPGIFYLMNGCNVTGGGYIKVNTIQIPVNVVYKVGREKGKRFFIGAGPYVAYNISASKKIGDSAVTTIAIGADKPNELKPLDIGVGVNAGILIDKLYIRIRTQLGFSNLNPGGNANNAINTFALGITAGYYIFSIPGKKSKTAGKE